MPPITDDYYLVLSAGRTGTVFLAHALNDQFANVTAEHEPSSSRWEHVWGNLRRRRGTDGSSLSRRLLRARKRKLSSLPARTKYVELNPLLCPLADLLPQLTSRLHVVHMVREPADWTASILKFKASGVWRWLIDSVPFALPYPRPLPPGWRSLSAVEKTLHRWRFCNESILEIADRCATYTLVRYEDLFSPDAETREACLTRFLRGLQIEPPLTPDWFPIGERKNASPDRAASTDIDPRKVRMICGELAERFGYAQVDLQPAEVIR